MIKNLSITLLTFLVTIFNAYSQKPWDNGDLKVSSDGHRLEHSNGTDFFWMGDTAWEMATRLDQNETETYLENRSERKFTVVQVMAISSKGFHIENVNGDQAFINGDIDSPNEAYWKNIDYIINKAEEKGLYVAFAPIWGYTHINQVRRLDTQSAETYGEFVGSRYRNNPNIIWLMGGDLPGNMGIEIWNTLANSIKSVDTNHLMTFHPKALFSSSRWFHDESWLDFNMMQSGHADKDPDTYTIITNDYNLHPNKPTIDGESRYENIRRGLHNGNDYIQPFEVRETAYWSLFAGAFGHTYGHSSIWEFTDGTTYGAYLPWKDALNAEGGSQMQYISELMQSRPLASRVPDQSLISGNAGSSANHIQATRGDGYAFFYIPSGNTVTINMGKISGSTVRAWWYNPRTGNASEIDTYSNNGSQSFNPPGSQERGNDWVLVLDNVAKNYGEPGEPGDNTSPTTYSLTIIDSNGYVSKSPDKESYNDGETITLTAEPHDGYKFDSWDGVDSSNGNEATITMDSNKTITAYFSEIDQPSDLYTLTIIDPNGYVAKSPDKESYNDGETITLTAEPHDGYKFDSWDGVDSSNGNKATITMNSNKTVTAYFSEIDQTSDSYALTINDDGGFVDITPYKDTYSQGETVTLIAVPNDGYKLNSWDGVDSSNGNKATVIMNSNKDVTAYFSEISYNIFPNPSSRVFNLNFSSTYRGDVFIKMYNTRGVLLKTLTLQKPNETFSYQFDLLDQSTGTYFLKIITDEYQSTKKIFKN